MYYGLLQSLIFFFKSVQAEEVVDHEDSNRMPKYEDQMTIFYCCQSNIVNGKMRRGIFKELAIDDDEATRSLS